MSGVCLTVGVREVVRRGLSYDMVRLAAAQTVTALPINLGLR